MNRSVVVDHLEKVFEIQEREPGLLGGLKSILSPQKKKHKVLDEISFSLQPGELVGFIGPNGAGKTTTLKILSGLLHPSSGFVSVLGYEPWKKEAEFLSQISVVLGQKNQLWWDLPARDTFELNKAIYSINSKQYKKTLHNLVDVLQVGNLIDIPVRKLSLGQRMKLELIASLLHSPKVMFLDEPTIGLDLIAQQSLRDFIYDYNRKNESTIIMTSHNMDDLVDLTRRVIVINKGTIVFDGLLHDLVRNFSNKKIIKVKFASNPDESVLGQIAQIKKKNFPEYSLLVDRDEVAFAASEILQSFEVVDLDIEEMPIEDVIRTAFKNEK